MAKLLSEIEATAGPAVHTQTVNADGLTPEGAASSKQLKTRKLAVVRAEEQVEQQPVVVVATVATVKPMLFKCNNHGERFPGEAMMRPLEAFPLRAEDGKRRGVYCKRCQNKLHSAYDKRKRAAVKNSPERLTVLVEQKRAELTALEQQLHDVLEHQITEVEAE